MERTHRACESSRIARNLDVDVAELLGRERIMFGTDYPFGSYKRQVEQVMIATEGDPKLRNLVFFENANRLLHIV